MNYPVHTGDGVGFALNRDARSGVGSYVPDQGVPGGIDPIALARKLWARRVLVLGFVAAGLAAALLYLFTATPRFSAEARILIEQRAIDPIRPDSTPSAPLADAQAIESEIEVLRSESIGGSVIGRLSLASDPEFNGALRRPGFLAWLASHAKGPRAEDPEWRRSQILEAFRDRLSVSQVGASRVIAVKFSSEDPRKAQEIANTLTKVYAEGQIAAKVDAYRRAGDWLTGHIETLRRTVQDSEAAVERYREETGLLRGTDSTLNVQTLSGLNAQLTEARARRMEIEARLRLVQSLLRSPGGVESAGEVLQSSLIQRLREQEVQIERRLAELSIKLLPANPEILKSEAELKDLRTRIRSEIDKIVEGLRNEAGIARSREASVQTELGSLKNVAARGNQSEVRLRALEREAAANRSLLELFLTRLKEVTAREDSLVQSSDARIISEARLPMSPSAPSFAPFLLLAALASALAGVLAVYIASLRDKGFDDEETLEEATGLPSLGTLPLIVKDTAERFGVGPREIAPTGDYDEALRSVETNLFLTEGGRLPRRILIASAVQGEGKTTTALNLARILALSGHKVALVDADMRDPGIHRAAGLAAGPGLAGVLLGSVKLDDVIQRDRASGVAVLVSGGAAANAPGLLASKAFDDLMKRLAKSYEVTIVDSPPLLTVPDARVLAAKADLTVLVVRWKEVRRADVLKSIRLLTLAGARCGGVLFSMVKRKETARYGEHPRRDAMPLAAE